jgi:hypothetical protein
MLVRAGARLGVLVLVAVLAACGSGGGRGGSPRSSASSRPTRAAQNLPAPLLPTPVQRRQIIAALDSQLTGQDGFVSELQGLQRLSPVSGVRHIDYVGLRLDVISVRVSPSRPLLASAAVELVDPRGRRVVPTAIVVLSTRIPDSRVVPGQWWWVLGPATSFPQSCTPAVEAGLRELLCPSPWTALGYRPPPAVPSGLGFTTAAHATNIRSVDWSDVSVPGSVCGAEKPIRLHDGSAMVQSAVEPWWPAVVVSTGLNPSYGKLAGRQVAVLGLACSNGGETADGELASAAVVYTLKARTLSVIGVLTPRQPLSPNVSQVPSLGRVTIRAGEVIAQEYWYAPGAGPAGPGQIARTFWKLSGGVLRPVRTVVGKLS